MRAVVTGATSLLGASVARLLADRGDDVVVFQRRPSGLGLDEHLGDITDADALRTAMTGADAVVHLSALVAPTGPWADFKRVNVAGTLNAVTTARSCGVSRFVHVSSPSVAHAGRSLAGAGADPADPSTARGHYAKSKAEGEILALDRSAPGFAVVAIRPHLVWGPGDTQLVGRIVERARQGRLAVIGSGAALIDTTYIDNAAEALIAAVDQAVHVGGRTFVVSNGQPRPVRELLDNIVAAAGLQSPRIRVPAALAKAGGAVAEKLWDRLSRDSEPPMTAVGAEQLSTAHWFDQRDTRSALDWQPRVSLDEGFARLAEWFATQPSASTAG